MAHFFFNLTDGVQTLTDRQGTELPSVEHALKRATGGGIPIMEGLNAVVRVSDQDGRDVLLAPLVLPEPNPDQKSQIDRAGRTFYEGEIFRVVNHDSLTGLANRRLFLSELKRATEAAQHDGVKLALVILKLDHLRDTNGTLGHVVGDSQLLQVAEALKSTIPETDTAARIGGDEFAIIVSGITSNTDGLACVEAIRTSLRRPVRHGEATLITSISAGVALFPDHGKDDVELYKSADIALHAAKTTAQGNVLVHTSKMRTEHNKRHAALAAARSALADARIIPYYQPKVSLFSGEIVGFEALLRWRHPTRGIQLPLSIADALDDVELACELGQQMQAIAFCNIGDWIRQGMNFGRIALNASPVQLVSGSYADELLKRLQEHDIPPTLIEIEVTETAVFGRDSRIIIGELQKLRAQGVAVSLDDFGTGYGTLIHVKELPINGLKIDRSFVGDIATDKHARVIVESIVRLAHSLGLSLVAEGIETPHQAEFLRSKGCDVVQGFLYSKAMPAGRVPKFLSTWSSGGRGGDRRGGQTDRADEYRPRPGKQKTRDH